MNKSLMCLVFVVALACNNSTRSKVQVPAPCAAFYFNNDTENDMQSAFQINAKENLIFAKGVDGKALVFKPENLNQSISLNSENLKFNSEKDFSIQFWVNCEMDSDKRTVILSTKRIGDNSINTQKQSGWVLGINHGNLFWNVGSGKRRLTYERDNKNRFPLNDGKWHQVTMTYSAELEEVRLYNDGKNISIYNLNDGEQFEFESETPLVLGWEDESAGSLPEILPAIKKGAKEIKNLVDEFDKLGLTELKTDELISLVVDPKNLFKEKVQLKKQTLGNDTLQFIRMVKNVDLEPTMIARSVLMKNPYTIYQVANFMEVAPMLKIYLLRDGNIIINEEIAKEFTQKEKLFQPDYKIDELKIWKNILTSNQVYSEYSKYGKEKEFDNSANKTTLVSAVWNIWHGGKHWTEKDHGWDSRVRIADMLRKENADVIMMQETYSSGDFIAAELGYYYATSTDWDYLNQGSNISVLSRYPITEIRVPKGASFMNVAAKVAISETQDIWVMSNWYGMSEFKNVYDFNCARFGDADNVPVLFGGDFNAVPHTDGGESPASEKMLNNGFTDAFRSLHSDVKEFPGYSHRGGYRIDQLYYKGKGIKNTSTEVISSHPNGFPSDHFLIISNFELN